MENEKPVILLTNDDGINSKGLWLLEDFFSTIGKVVVVAPAEHQSAMSTSISINKKEGLKVCDEGFNRYSIYGTPADCVAWGISFLDRKVDLVVSGCNRGYNISNDTIYSGTVGACNQAHMLGYPSIAISADVDFTNVKAQIGNIYKYLIDNNLISKKYILNINIPNTEEVKGFRITKLAKSTHYVRIVEVGEAYQYRGRSIVFPKNENDDNKALREGYISITPLKSTTFYDDAYKKLKKLNKD